ncbi:MAG TPA: (2Fe-2S)-binding protein [Xylella sp.]
MYICICNAVTDERIQEVAASCANFTELTIHTGCGSHCGSCLNAAAELFGRARAACVVQAVTRSVSFDSGAISLVTQP